MTCQVFPFKRKLHFDVRFMTIGVEFILGTNRTRKQNLFNTFKITVYGDEILNILSKRNGAVEIH